MKIARRRKKMCGIVGCVGGKFVDSVLIAGLERLEYRGYVFFGKRVRH